MNQLWVAPVFKPIFDRLLADGDLFNRLDELEGEVYREVARRRTLRVILAGEPYFLKIHHGVGWKEIFKNLLQLRLPVLGARNEWRALQRLEQYGIPAMKPVLFMEQGASPATRRSAILTRSLDERTSLEDYLPHDVTEKRRLLVSIAGMARDMHNCGINHRDFYLCHFLMADNDHDDLKLIDLHRAQLRDRVPERWVAKDLGSLLFSAVDKSLTRRDLLRFVRIYRQRPLREVLGRETGFWRRVVSRAARLYLQDHAELPDHIRDLLAIP